MSFHCFSLDSFLKISYMFNIDGNRWKRCEFESYVYSSPNKLVRENKACTVKETLTLALCPTLNTVPDPWQQPSEKPRSSPETPRCSQISEQVCALTHHSRLGTHARSPYAYAIWVGLSYRLLSGFLVVHVVNSQLSLICTTAKQDYPWPMSSSAVRNTNYTGYSCFLRCARFPDTGEAKRFSTLWEISALYLY